jgi:hypothetical protein
VDPGCSIDTGVWKRLVIGDHKKYVGGWVILGVTSGQQQKDKKRFDDRFFHLFIF